MIKPHMSQQALQALLAEKIPVTQFMQVEVVDIQPDSLTVKAPLAPNLNIHDTMFGGSATAIGLVAAWSLFSMRLANAGVNATVVAHKNASTYLKPIAGELVAKATFANLGAWQSFMDRFTEKGRARFFLHVQLLSENQLAGEIEAEFVAIKSD
jgi:thioesterase domain-containing protein